ncbi:MAG: divalent-cation tolerance protein CutA [Candidatus Omnitrophica bacterium]|nr:divalent-cation tolerance protein CutA [Candidatus Omnitrophota bacterium]
MPAACRLVLSTCPTRPVARRLASTLVRRRLAACVNVVPGLTSYFWWQGTLERASECLLIIKTTQRRVPELIAALHRLHPYDVPEIIAVPITAGHRPYLEWIDASCRPAR